DVPEYGRIPRESKGFEEIPLSPTLPISPAGFVSAGALLLKAKQFDDGLYAAAEMAAQQGAGGFAGKTAVLPAVAAVADPSTAPLLYAACALGGLNAAPPGDLQEAVAAVRTRFLDDELRSKPLGFYTWTDSLRAIFRQDRLLQQPLKFEQAHG